MNNDVAGAVALLQSRVAASHNHWYTERAEEALNSLLAQPDRVGTPSHLARNALADAGKKLRLRARILKIHATTIDWIEVEVNDDFAQLLVETTDLLSRHLSVADQSLLECACCLKEVKAV